MVWLLSPNYGMGKEDDIIDVLSYSPFSNCLSSLVIDEVLGMSRIVGNLCFLSDHGSQFAYCGNC